MCSSTLAGDITIFMLLTCLARYMFRLTKFTLNSFVYSVEVRVANMDGSSWPFCLLCRLCPGSPDGGSIVAQQCSCGSIPSSPRTREFISFRGSSFSVAPKLSLWLNRGSALYLWVNPEITLVSVLKPDHPCCAGWTERPMYLSATWLFGRLDRPKR